MENSFQTSFIPKKPINFGTPKKEPKSFFSLIAVFILIVTILASGSLFFYKNYLIQQKKSFSDSLSLASDSFEKSTVEELDIFNKHTEAARQILSNHVVLSPVFSLLEKITIPSVQYTKFNQEFTEKESIVKIEGVARDYRSIILQSDAFNTTLGKPFKNVVFSSLSKNKDNSIIFNLEFNVDPSLLSYEKNFSSTSDEALKDSNSTQ
jgi:hypothetical protein